MHNPGLERSSFPNTLAKVLQVQHGSSNAPRNCFEELPWHALCKPQSLTKSRLTMKGMVTPMTSRLLRPRLESHSKTKEKIANRKRANKPRSRWTNPVVRLPSPSGRLGIRAASSCWSKRFFKAGKSSWVMCWLQQLFRHG